MHSCDASVGNTSSKLKAPAIPGRVCMYIAAALDHTRDVRLSECFKWHRVLKKVPEAIETFADKAAGLLTDRHHGVLLSGTTLMLEICEIEPNTIEQYRRHVPMLCKILRSLLMSGFAPEHDVGGITDPFLQVKVCTNHITNSWKHALQPNTT